MSQAQPAAGRQNVRHGSLVSAVRAEALKSKHGAPLRLAIALSLPAPLLAAFIVAAWCSRSIATHMSRRFAYPLTMMGLAFRQKRSNAEPSGSFETTHRASTVVVV
ncbi:Uncharacterised protein [Slackia heliotrinireducens]|uniref:hypothetical protein n=1 Tax=Slackia heliotrinireducens TaxID=84110 RepID=UPI00059E169A|nr:hypothetical protein [Slackia heliotrinireducens]VEG98874.1 Uncharacterised protein [Slackia heliotrinireducens]